MDQKKREDYIQKLINLRVTGKGVGHPRAHNLKVIERIQKGDEKATLGLDSLVPLELEKLLDAIAGITGCSKDISYTEGEGFIDPEATLDGLVNASELIAKACKEKKNIVLATGHPGSMLGFYLELEKTIRIMGGNVLALPLGAFVDEYKCPGCGLHNITETLDSISGVAVVSNGSSLIHTHKTKAMEKIIDSMRDKGIAIDMVIADHGYAGRALTRGLDVIAVMDTNDPALAAAKKVGYDLTIIPMDDNRPNYISKQVGEILSELICVF